MSYFFVFDFAWILWDNVSLADFKKCEVDIKIIIAPIIKIIIGPNAKIDKLAIIFSVEAAWSEPAVDELVELNNKRINIYVSA